MIISEMLAAGCGLGAALSWGAGDFSGGNAAKKNHVLSVLFVAQILGAVLLALSALVLGEALPPTRDLLLGAGAGILGMIGLMALYSGLASGRMGLVAPLSAVTAAALPRHIRRPGRGPARVLADNRVRRGPDGHLAAHPRGAAASG